MHLLRSLAAPRLLSRSVAAFAAWPVAAKVVAGATTVLVAGVVAGGSLSAAGGGAREAAGGSLHASEADTDLVPEAPPTADAARRPDGTGDVVSVLDIVDGDTIKVSDVGTVRLIGVDTPETVHPSEPVGCMGPEASAHTAAAVPPGTEVRLVYDVARLDRYGRTLAYVYRAHDGGFLNLELVAGGFAQVSTYPPNVAHADDFLRAQREARAEGRGLWGERCSHGDAAPVPTGTSGSHPPAPTTSPAPPATELPVTEAAYPDCAAARAAGAAPVLRGEPGYGAHLDGDGDGIGCEADRSSGSRPGRR